MAHVIICATPSEVEEFSRGPLKGATGTHLYYVSPTSWGRLEGLRVSGYTVTAKASLRSFHSADYAWDLSKCIDICESTMLLYGIGKPTNENI